MSINLKKAHKPRKNHPWRNDLMIHKKVSDFVTLSNSVGRTNIHAIGGGRPPCMK
ncbi:hypothetical protein J5TS2_41130 [Brevibacillus halotolerans]|nr:hypothetical protein J5TS2_41130 [Brevibacillus halotolerans]